MQKTGIELREAVSGSLGWCWQSSARWILWFKHSYYVATLSSSHNNRRHEQRLVLLSATWQHAQCYGMFIFFTETKLSFRMHILVCVYVHHDLTWNHSLHRNASFKVLSIAQRSVPFPFTKVEKHRFLDSRPNLLAAEWGELQYFFGAPARLAATMAASLPRMLLGCWQQQHRGGNSAESSTLAVSWCGLIVIVPKHQIINF